MKLFVMLLALLFPTISLAQGLPLKDGSASTLGTISSCGGSENCLKSTGPTTQSGAGFQSTTGVSGAGISATGKRYNPVYATEGGGQQIAPQNILWDDTFNATAQNTSKYRFASTTQAGAQTGGFIILNSSTITTTNTNSAWQTFRSFPLLAKGELRVTFAALHTTAPQANAVTEWGLFTATIPGGAAPADGCFFRFNAATEFRGVCSFNATETQTAAITATTANVTHDYRIVIQTNTVVFYVDDLVVGTLTLLTDAPSEGQPLMQAAVPVTVRHYIGGSAPALGMQFRVSDVFVTSLGPDLSRAWGEQKAGFGHMAYQGQNGGTMGTTAQYANNANPATAVPTNTTAALGTGLGGIFQETLTLAAATDGVISSFQNPTGSVTQTPRTLVIKGVCVGGVVTVALTTNALAGTLALNYGHTTVSLATTESASFTTGTAKAPRRIALYTTSVANATATPATPVVTGPSSCIPFSSPVVVAPGEFVAISHKKITAAPATGSIMWTITFDAYFE